MSKKVVELNTYSGAFSIRKKHLKKCFNELFNQAYKSLAAFKDEYTFDDAELIYHHGLNRGYIL